MAQARLTEFLAEQTRISTQKAQLYQQRALTLAKRQLSYPAAHWLILGSTVRSMSREFAISSPRCNLARSPRIAGNKYGATVGITLIRNVFAKRLFQRFDPHRSCRLGDRARFSSPPKVSVNCADLEIPELAKGQFIHQKELSI